MTALLTTTTIDEEEEAVTTMAAEVVPAVKPVTTKDQQLLTEIERVFRRFMFYPHAHAFTVSTLLVAHTHLRDQDGNFLPRATPRGYTGSMQPGCGKTMDLELKTLMSFNGEIVLEPTEPGLISKLHNDKATVGLTEIDLFFGSRGTAKSGHRAIINGGYKRGATKDRERNGETEKLNVHGPMFLDGKNLRRFLQVDGPFDTLRTRSIVTALEKKPAGVQLEEYDSERHEPRLRSISKRMALWGMRHGKEVVRLDVDGLIPARIQTRDREIWRVLFQVAAFVGGGWVERVTAAARALVLGEWGEDDVPQLSPAEQLLEAAREAYVLDDGGFLPTRVLVQRLMQGDGWWRKEWTSPKAASMSLADELGTFGVETVREYVGGKQERGYRLVDLLSVDEPDSDEAEEPATDVAEWDWSELDDED